MSCNTIRMLVLRPQWLLAIGILGGCGSPDLAEAGGEAPGRLCTLVYAPSGFGISFAVGATTASRLEGATVSVCRAGGSCYSKAIHHEGDFWLCDRSPHGFYCEAFEQDGTLIIFTFVDVNADRSTQPLEDGDVWWGTLTDAQGQVVLSQRKAVEYVAICANFTPACGVAFQAMTCVSDEEVDCPATDLSRRCPGDAGIE
jgi:hypothetical protein